MTRLYLRGLGLLAVFVAFSLASSGCESTPTEEQVIESTVTLISPAEGAVLANACMLEAAPRHIWTFDWSEVASATRYHLFVKKRTATHPLLDRFDITESAHRAELFGYIINENLEGWAWKVRAQVADRWGPWSDERSFSVEPLNTGCL